MDPAQRILGANATLAVSSPANRWYGASRRTKSPCGHHSVTGSPGAAVRAQDGPMPSPS